ncbi:MAG: hypothetical protein KF791_05525 [Verrucomicrobiae bacterium]|nr:hypothetical protein [Verrucomicrobiae bacterium]
MNKLLLLPILVTLAGLQAAAQVPNAGLSLAITQARQQNATLMQQYSWNCRTELTEYGTVKDTRIDTVTWGPNNQPQYTILNDIQNPLPRGFFRRRIAENERQQTEQFITGLRTFLHQYTLPSAGQMLNFISSAAIPPPDANGVLQLTGGSVVVPDDSVSLWISAPTKATRRMTIMTSYQGHSVSVTATWKMLANGLNYMAYAQINVPDEGMILTVQNYDYINQDL